MKENRAILLSGGQKRVSYGDAKEKRPRLLQDTTARAARIVRGEPKKAEG